MRTALRIGAGMDDSQSVELRDRAGMAVTVLTLQQCGMTRAAAEVAQFVGWVSLPPSLVELRRTGRSTHPTNRPHAKTCRRCVSCKIQTVRLISSSKRISDSNQTSRHVRFALHVRSGSLPRAG